MRANCKSWNCVGYFYLCTSRLLFSLHMYYNFNATYSSTPNPALLFSFMAKSKIHHRVTETTPLRVRRRAKTQACDSRLAAQFQSNKTGKKAEAGDALVCSCIYLLACAREQIKRIAPSQLATSVYVHRQCTRLDGKFTSRRSARFFTAAAFAREIIFIWRIGRARGSFRESYRLPYHRLAAVVFLSFSRRRWWEEKLWQGKLRSRLVSFAKLAPFRSAERLDRCQKSELKSACTRKSTRAI